METMVYNQYIMYFPITADDLKQKACRYAMLQSMTSVSGLPLTRQLAAFTQI